MGEMDGLLVLDVGVVWVRCCMVAFATLVVVVAALMDVAMGSVIVLAVAKTSSLLIVVESVCCDGSGEIERSVEAVVGSLSLPPG